MYLKNFTSYLVLLVLLFSGCLIHSPKQELFPFMENNKWGYKTQDGEVIIEPIYDRVDGTLKDYQHVVVAEKWGIINDEGNYIIPPLYDYISDFEPSGLTLAKLNGAYGFINKKGETIIPFIYQDAWGFRDGLSMVKKNNKWGYMDETGKLIVPIEYDEIDYKGWSEGIIGVKKDQKWGFIDKNNTLVIPFKYYEVNKFSEGLALVADTYNKWGYIDHNNNKVIPCIYEYPNHCGHEGMNFKNGIAMVRLNDKSGYIDKSGKTVIPFNYYCLHHFAKGYAYAEVDNGKSIDGWSGYKEVVKYGYIDSTGKEYLFDTTDFSKMNWKITPAPKEIPDHSHLLKSSDSTKMPFTLEKLLASGLIAFRQEPKIYPDLSNLNQICIGYGLRLSGGNYCDYMYGDAEGFREFKTKTIYKIISTESLRQAVWSWISPYYKKAFQSMNPFVQKTYKEIAVYLKNYVNTYNKAKVLKHLKKDEKKFAYYDMNGKLDENRKIGAFIDRLIIIHKAISIEDTKTWINKIADEVVVW